VALMQRAPEAAYMTAVTSIVEQMVTVLRDVRRAKRIEHTTSLTFLIGTMDKLSDLISNVCSLIGGKLQPDEERFDLNVVQDLRYKMLEVANVAVGISTELTIMLDLASCLQSRNEYDSHEEAYNQLFHGDTQIRLDELDERLLMELYEQASNVQHRQNIKNMTDAIMQAMKGPPPGGVTH